MEARQDAAEKALQEEMRTEELRIVLPEPAAVAVASAGMSGGETTAAVAPLPATVTAEPAAMESASVGTSGGETTAATVPSSAAAAVEGTVAESAAADAGVGSIRTEGPDEVLALVPGRQGGLREAVLPRKAGASGVDASVHREGEVDEEQLALALASIDSLVTEQGPVAADEAAVADPVVGEIRQHLQAALGVNALSRFLRCLSIRSFYSLTRHFDQGLVTLGLRGQELAAAQAEVARL
jgi:hypothetical protein